MERRGRNRNNDGKSKQDVNYNMTKRTKNPAMHSMINTASAISFCRNVHDPNEQSGGGRSG